jgi:hypothetical protein
LRLFASRFLHGGADAGGKPAAAAMRCLKLPFTFSSGQAPAARQESAPPHAAGGRTHAALDDPDVREMARRDAGLLPQRFPCSLSLRGILHED